MADRFATPSPALMMRSGLCIGCGSCIAQQHAQCQGELGRSDIDSLSVAMRLDRFGELKPFGSRDWLRLGPKGFSRTCPFSPDAANEDQLASALFDARPYARDERTGHFRSAWVGHAVEPGFRERGSSGGMLGWTAAELLRTSRVDAVAHVLPSSGDRMFHYGFSRSEDELARGAKSRYYPVELSAVIHTIRSVPGRYAVTGLPCFIKAIQLLRREDDVLRERIVATLGLFCGHMKSSRLIESFARQMKLEMTQVNAADFRLKDARRPANWYTAYFSLKDGGSAQRDWFHLLEGDWGAGFFQNAACDACDDVMAETADIAFGDAWVEPYSSDGRGTNVVVVRSAAMHALVCKAVDEGRLSLSPVDADFLANTQAAGLRQRREGLAYRLARDRRSIRVSKRVASSSALPPRRKMIYRLRAGISRWSRRVYRLSRVTHSPWLYAAWARVAMAAYRSLAYSSGWGGRALSRLIPERPAASTGCAGRIRPSDPA